MFKPLRHDNRSRAEIPNRLPRGLRSAGAALLAALALSISPALAQTSGGVLKIYHRDNPHSASIHEEATTSTVVPFMPRFNNLVVYDQHVAQNSDQSIVPDLAKSWRWNDEMTALTFQLREGVMWHDGIPFTARDVVCTFDMTFPWEVTPEDKKIIKGGAPAAVCETTSMNLNINLLVNRTAPPFDNADMRRALMLALDRKAFVDTLTEATAEIGGTMQPAHDGV